MLLFFMVFSSLFITTEAHASGFTFLSQVEHATHIGEHILTFSLVSILILVVGLIYKAKVNKAVNPIIPDRGITLRNIIEAYGSFMMTQAKAVIGEEEGPKYFNFVSALFLIILCSNLIGIIPGFLPPTENLNTTLALGAIAFLYYNIKGCKEQGVINYLKHFAGPLWYMAILIFPIEIISNFVRPVSLALRLRGNMYGDHLVLGVFSGLIPYIIPVIFLVLGILVSCIQAYVFTMLTMVYISLAVSHHDHGDEHAHG